MILEKAKSNEFHSDRLDIKDTLFEYVTNPETWFYWYHNPKRLKALYDDDHKNDKDHQEDKNNDNFTKKIWRFGKPKKVNRFDSKESYIQEDLYNFFYAVLDEIRIKTANAFSEYALSISDIGDLSYFRDTTTRREIVADIDYNRHRDHAAHTLYNYILGWYFFEKSEKVQDAFFKYFDEKLNINLTLRNNSEEYEFYLDKKNKYCLIVDSLFEKKLFSSMNSGTYGLLPVCCMI